jgi:hypothetical protein
MVMKGSALRQERRQLKGPSTSRRRSKSWWLLLFSFLLLVALLLQLSMRLPSTTNHVLANPSIPEHRTRWAYVFLLADCDPSHPSYRGMLYNILVSTYLLKYDQDTVHSRADILVLIQMANNNNYTSRGLPKPEEALLERMNIQYRYLPTTPTTEASSTSSYFYQLVLAKFRVLELVEYSRILFLDGDVLPLCNLDYLLDLSEQGIFQEHVLHAMYEDPVNAGLWVATPRPGYYAEIERLVQHYQIHQQWGPQSIDYRLWDGKRGSGWDFYCANSDQGLLLYWTRFVRRQVSIVVGSTIEHYQDGEQDDEPRTVSSHRLSQYSCFPNTTTTNRKGTFSQNANPRAASLPFYQDFYHMVGYSKAWELPLQTTSIPSHKAAVRSSTEYWYFLLQRVQQEFDINKVIPPLDQLLIEKPRLRGDLFAVGHAKDTMKKKETIT